MSDSYTTAALRGMGMDDSYTDAALRGFGCDCGGSYTDAALRGMGRFRKGSTEAKRYMAHLRAMRSKSKAGKKLKGGIAFSTIATALGLIPTAIKGAHAIYKWITGSGLLSSKGGHAIILDPDKRESFIKYLQKNGVAKKKLGGLSPYTMKVAPSKASKRKSSVVPAINEYLTNNDLMDKALYNAASWKRYVAKARKALKLKRAYKQSSTDAVLPLYEKKTTKKRKRPRIQVFSEPASPDLEPMPDAIPPLEF